MIVDFFLDQCNSSWNVDTALSVSAIELVIAANNTNKKKMIPIPVPSPILANTLGIVMNIKEKELANAIAAIPDMVDFISLLYRSMPEVHDRIVFFGTETEQLLRTLMKP